MADDAPPPSSIVTDAPPPSSTACLVKDVGDVTDDMPESIRQQLKEQQDMVEQGGPDPRFLVVPHRGEIQWVIDALDYIMQTSTVIFARQDNLVKSLFAASLLQDVIRANNRLGRVQMVRGHRMLGKDAKEREDYVWNVVGDQYVDILSMAIVRSTGDMVKQSILSQFVYVPRKPKKAKEGKPERKVQFIKFDFEQLIKTPAHDSAFFNRVKDRKDNESLAQLYSTWRPFHSMPLATHLYDTAKGMEERVRRGVFDAAFDDMRALTRLVTKVPCLRQIDMYTRDNNVQGAQPGSASCLQWLSSDERVFVLDMDYWRERSLTSSQWQEWPLTRPEHTYRVSRAW